VGVHDDGEGAAGAALAVVKPANAGGRGCAAPLFVGSELAGWTLVGVAADALCRPHGPFAVWPPMCDAIGRAGQVKPL
jgi:hypothetical protein